MNGIMPNKTERKNDMTSANLLNVKSAPQQLIQPNKAINPAEKPEKNFGAMLSESVKKPNANDTQFVGEKNVKADSKAVSNDDNKDIRYETKKNPVKEQKEEKNDIPSEEEFKEAVEEFEKKVKKVLKDAFDITDEDIESAMETLSLVVTDLTEPKGLMPLVTELLGEDDSVNLIMDENVNTVLGEVGAVSEELSEELNLPLDAVREIFAEMTEVTETETIDPEIVVNLDGQNEKVFTEDNGKAVPLPETEITDGDVKIEDKDIRPVKEDTVITDDKNIVNTVKENGTDVKEANPENVRVNDNKTEGTEKVSDGITVVVNKESAENDGAEAESNDSGSQGQFKNPANENRNPLFELNQEPINAGETNVNKDINIQQPLQAEAPEPPVRERYVNVNTNEVITQIVEHARTTITREVQSMEMVLNPEHLGKLYMEVSHKNGEVSARLVAENENVRAALEMQAEVLKEQLSGQGIKIQSVEVSVGTHEFEKNLEEGQMQDESRQEAEEEAKRRKTSGERNLNLNDGEGLLDDLTEEEELKLRMMHEAGNTMNLTA